MYQALYRKWRPKTFDDVVGQTHITDTIKRQVEGGRLSHAYLFTGTRGTGKTSCAKILARAVNCENLQHGNPCNACPACLGIENGSILDVLELDAASNNGVDQVRALRDEAVYTPAAVRKRVYIVDEVHMLSTAAFNALLKILEEPPSHLLFILATTELHKVPATIRSRCQQFAFKRILPMEIAQRLSFVAAQEEIELSHEGAALLARLADGGLRDALSLLDQCAGVRRVVGEQEILDTLGLAGNLETANLMGQLANHDTAAALDTLSRLYEAGKDVGSVLSELSGLTRDLLLRKTAPQGGSALLTGGYDETTMRQLGEQLTAQRLLQMLTQLQTTTADLARSSNRRTDAELCLIRLSQDGLDESLAGLAARVARLEEQVANGVPQNPAPTAGQSAPQPLKRPAAARLTPAPPPSRPVEERPPWEGECPPLPEEPPLPGEPPFFDEPPQEMEYVFDVPEESESVPPQPSAPPPRPAPAPRRERKSQRTASVSTPLDADGENRAFWPSFAAGLQGKVSPLALPYLKNPEKVLGVWNNGTLTLWVDKKLTQSIVNKPDVIQELTRAASAAFGCQAQVHVMVGRPPVPQAEGVSAPRPAAPVQPSGQPDAMDELLAFGAKFDNIIIQ